MARYPYRQQPQMVDTGDVPYVSYISEQAEPLMMQAAANAQQRYDLAQTAIAKYLEENAAAKFRDADYNTVMAKLNQDLENIKATVKDRYDNQYGQAYPEILKGLSKARQTYHLAQKAYEEEQKYAPMYAKLQAEGKLLFPEGDPRTRSVFNQEGQYVGGVDFSKFRERSDYDKIIDDAVVRGIDKTAVESGLINSKTAGYLLQLQRSGLAALGNTEQEIDDKIDKIAEEYAPIFEAKTTYGIDPDRPKISSKEYVKDAIYRLASSKTGRQYMADRNYDPNGGKSPGTPTNVNPIFSTFEAPLPLVEKSKIIADYKKNKELFNKVNINKGKLEILYSVKGITSALQQKLTPGAVGSSLMYLDDKDKVQFNNWIEAAMLQEPEKVGKFVMKDKEGNYTFGANKAAGSVYIGNLLYEMSNNDDNYLDKVTIKYNKAKQEFEKEYRPMMDYIMENTGVSEDVAMQKIQEYENLLKFGKTFSFNDKSIVPIIKTNLLSRSGESAQIYEVNEKGEVSTKPRKATEEFNKDKTGDIINVEVDPIEGQIIMTSEKGKKFAIKSGKGSLSVASDNILNEIKEFSSTLNSSKKPQSIIQTRGGDNYLIMKDPNTLESTIFKVQKVGDKWRYVSTEPLSEESVYGELMTRLYMSLGGTNTITPNKI